VSPEDPATRGLTCFQVGGTVRDRLLGRVARDRDFVVVGAAPEAMLRRGFRPVGADFPVFLHPHSGEEYALARTERKHGHGYRGFVVQAHPEVTLEEDLRRRDLTINAMALAEDGTLIDPFGGRLDLERRVLRHVSPAFAEDPLRVLRVARFAARFDDFRVAEETLALCRSMVASGELIHLVAERVWQETARALMERRPSVFFDRLRDSGALAVVFPEIDALFGVPQVAQFHPEIDAGRHTLMVIDQAARLGSGLAVRYACLVHDLGKALTPAEQLPNHHGHELLGMQPIGVLSERLRVPGECRELAELFGRYHLQAHRAFELKPATVLRLLKRLDAFRRPHRLGEFLAAATADRRGRLGREHDPYPQAAYLKAAAQEAGRIEAGPFLAQGLQGPAVGQAMDQARERAIDLLRRDATAAPGA